MAAKGRVDVSHCHSYPSARCQPLSSSWDPTLTRWQPDARGRLRQAALELYGEHGYDQTTVAQIAERAGLTERTFYRHFADKREVVFSGEVHRVLVDTVAEAPAKATEIEAVTAALEAAGAVLDQRRDLTRQRQAVIAANPSLQQREQIKYAALAADLAGALRVRGAEPLSAQLSAGAGVVVFRTAFERWIDVDERDFGRIVRNTLATLADLMCTGEPPTLAPGDRWVPGSRRSAPAALRS